VSPRTLFLSRLIGLYCIVIALSMMTRRQATVERVTALLQNPSMILIVGIVTLAAGLAVVLAHNIWSGRALAVVVTLVGWITLIKSLFFLFLPPEMEAGIFLGHSFTTDNSSTRTQLFRSSWACTSPTVDSRQGQISH
jgi:vacuolar-type H+-ATPase subunit I/STV1